MSLFDDWYDKNGRDPNNANDVFEYIDTNYGQSVSGASSSDLVSSRRLKRVQRRPITFSNKNRKIELTVDYKTNNPILRAIIDIYRLENKKSIHLTVLMRSLYFSKREIISLLMKKSSIKFLDKEHGIEIRMKSNIAV